MNKVDIFSNNHGTTVYIDGMKIKGIQKVQTKREVGCKKATMILEFKCDLTTKEQPIE